MCRFIVHERTMSINVCIFEISFVSRTCNNSFKMNSDHKEILLFSGGGVCFNRNDIKTRVLLSKSNENWIKY